MRKATFIRTNYNHCVRAAREDGWIFHRNGAHSCNAQKHRHIIPLPRGGPVSVIAASIPPRPRGPVDHGQGEAQHLPGFEETPKVQHDGSAALQDPVESTERSDPH